MYTASPIGTRKSWTVSGPHTLPVQIRPVVQPPAGLQIDSFRGDVGELSDFVSSVWRESYAGRMTCPVWSPEYMQWHFPLDQPGVRDYLLAAYDGSRLAGVLLGKPFSYRTAERRIAGSLWSWLSIHPSYQGRRLAVQLDQERVRRMREAGNRLVVSYRFFGSRHSQAERPGVIPDPYKQFLHQMRFWSRILDPVRFQRWDLKRWEGLLGLLSYPVAGISGPGQWESAIRPARVSDIPALLALLNRTQQECSLAIQWNAIQLRNQLFGSPLTRTLVCEQAGTVRGVINFHVLDFLGRQTPEPIGIVDLAAMKELPGSAQAALVNVALQEMRQMGAILALMPGLGQLPVSTLLRTRWSPTARESHVVLQWTGEPVPVKSDLPLHLLWR